MEPQARSDGDTVPAVVGSGVTDYTSPRSKMSLIVAMIILYIAMVCYALMELSSALFGLVGRAPKVDSTD